MGTNRYKYLLFDLDGTLTDSGIGIMRSAKYALEKMGVEVRDVESLRPFVGPPLEDSFKMFFGFSDENAAEAVRLYRERYKEIGVYENEPYAGVADCLDLLKSKGYRLAIGTSRPMDMTMVVLKHFGLERFFDYVGARDAEGLLHTKADVLRSVIVNMGIENTDEAIMIGDKKFDVAGAKEVGLRCIGVTWGYGGHEELECAGADIIVDSFDDLCAVL